MVDFLVDQDVYAVTIDWLRKGGHDVVTAKQISMEAASDENLLNEARQRFRILLTRDKGFWLHDFLKPESINRSDSITHDSSNHSRSS